METGGGGQSYSREGMQSITPTGSPFVWQNDTGRAVMVFVADGTVTDIEYSRDGTYVHSGMLSGWFYLNPNDNLRVTYVTAPTMKYAKV